MAAPDVDQLDSPLPAYRGTRTVAVGADAVEVEGHGPFTVRVNSAGVLHFVDATGHSDSRSGLSEGDDIVGPGDGLVYVRRILGSGDGTTVTSVMLGIT